MKSTCLLLLTLIILSSCTQKEEAKTSLTFLRTSGQYMVNEQNDTILLRGVGLGNWLLPEGYKTFYYTISILRKSKRQNGY